MNNISYSFPYLLFLFYLFLIVLWEFSLKAKGDRRLKKIRIVIWGSFLFFFGLRGFVNTDCLSYYPFFEGLKTVWDGYSYGYVLSEYDWEPGFITVVYLLKSIIPNYFVWTFVWTLIAIIALDSFFSRNVKYYSLGFLLFFIFGGYGILVNLMRGSIAMFIFLYSIRFLEKGDSKKYFLVNTVGCLFHISSVLYLLAYFILKRRLSFPFLLGVFLFLNLLYWLRIDFSNILIPIMNNISYERISLLVESYIEEGSNGELLSIGYIERCFTYIVVLMMYTKLARSKPDSIIYLNAYVLYYILFYFFWQIDAASQRMAGLFIFTKWIIYSDLYAILKIPNNKKLFLLLLLVYSSLKMISGQSQPYHQYKNILFNNERFEEAERRIQM
uniref:EpsG family protein n=1 Tax=Bacteroides stercoris TaxID=46506 RepID=UPI00101BF798|nr:EpsG family protein [Bacteroides stercoris]